MAVKTATHPKPVRIRGDRTWGWEHRQYPNGLTLHVGHCRAHYSWGSKYGLYASGGDYPAGIARCVGSFDRVADAHAAAAEVAHVDTWHPRDLPYEEQVSGFVLARFDGRIEIVVRDQPNFNGVYRRVIRLLCQWDGTEAVDLRVERMENSLTHSYGYPIRWKAVDPTPLLAQARLDLLDKATRSIR